MSSTSVTTNTKGNKNADKLHITKDMWLVIAASFCFMATNMLANPLVAGYAEDLGAPGSLMGVVAAVMSFVSLFCRPIAGNLSDRTSKRKLAIIGAALYFIAGLLYYVAPSPAVLIVARVINGVGFACCSVCLATWMALLLPKKNMGSGMGVYGVAAAIAMAVGPAIGIRIQEAFGYRTAFLMSLVLPVLMLICVLLVGNSGNPVKSTETRAANNDKIAAADADTTDLPQSDLVEAPVAEAASETTSKRKFSLRSIIEPKVVPVTLTFMMIAIPYFANQSFIVNYAAKRDLNVNADLFFIFYAVALLAMRFGMKSLFDKLPLIWWMVICTVSLVLSLLCLTFMTNNWMLLLAGILTASSFGIMSSVTQAQAMSIAGRERSGIANGTYYAGIDLGMAIGPFLGGFIYNHLPISWFYLVFLVCVPIAWIIYLCFVRGKNEAHV